MLSLCHYTKYTVLSDDSVRNIVIAINILSLIIAGPGNIITISVIAKTRKLREQPTYLFIGSVCLADSLVSCITQPLYITTLLLESNDRYCVLYQLFFVFGWLSAFGSVIGLNMVTLDRYMYITFPLRYPEKMNRRRAITLIILTWMIAVLFAVIPVVWLNSTILHSLLFAHNSVSCVLVFFTYQRIYKQVRFISSKHTCMAAHEDHAAQRQATKTVFIVVFFFVVCWGPWTVLSFMMSIKEQLVDDIGVSYHQKTFKIVQSMTLTMGFMGSAVNVFIYTFKNKELKKEWKKFIFGLPERKK